MTSFSKSMVTTWLNAAGKRAITAEETARLLKKLSNTTDEKERNLLINRICSGNLKLVYRTAKGFSDNRGMIWGNETSVDLLQEGVFGLTYAIERYDISRGTKLSTVAVPWIRQKLGRYHMNQHPTIRIPEHLVREVLSIRDHGKLLNRRTTPKNKLILQMACLAYGSTLSLDAPSGNKDEDGTVLDLIPQPSVKSGAERQDAVIAKIKEIMAMANIEPKTQEFLLEYARLGVISSAAVKTRVCNKRAGRLLKDAIARMQDLV